MFLVWKQSLRPATKLIHTSHHILILSRANNPINFSRLAELKQDPHLLVDATLQLLEIDYLGILVPQFARKYLRCTCNPALLVITDKFIDPFLAEVCDTLKFDITELVDIVENQLNFSLAKGCLLKLSHWNFFVFDLVQEF